MLTKNEIIERLRYHNEWRRGAEIEQMAPSDIGEIIDGAITLLERSDNSGYAVQPTASPKVCPLCLGDKEWENNQTAIVDTCPCCNGTGQTFA